MTGPPPEDSELTTWLFEPESFSPLAKIVGDKKYSIITDHLGTPYEMYDEQGAKVWGLDLDIYGQAQNVFGDRQFCPFRFPGQYDDIEVNLYYNRFRYYDPEVGNYIAQDPIGLDGGNPNIYGYVEDPLLYFDPLGLQKCGSEIDSKKMKELGIEDVKIRGKSYNAGKKSLESQGFKYKGKTGTGRRIFEHPTKGTRVSYDGTPKSLAGKQKPHWHIQDRGGAKYNDKGIPAAQDKFKGHIPSDKGTRGPF